MIYNAKSFFSPYHYFKANNTTIQILDETKILNYIPMTTKGITNNTTLITNNANLVQVGDSAFTGTIAANGGVYTPTIVGSNGLEYNTTTTTGIHNFKIYGTPKV